MSQVATHPRIRARRIEVAKDEGRRRLRKLVVVAAVVGALGALWGLALTPLLDVDHVRVEGAARTGDAVVAGATGIHLGDPMVTTRLAGAASKVARLPWVETVHVHRRWPGTVVVRVVERTPVAAVPAKEGGWVLLDGTGRQLAVVPEPAAGLLRVELPPLDAAPGATLTGETTPLLELAMSRPAALADRLVALRPVKGVGVEGTVALRDGGRATVVLGAPSQAAAKWLALVSVLDSAEPRGLVTIDLRVPSAPALTRR